MFAAGLGQFGSSLTSQQAGSYPRQSQGGSTLRFVAVSLFLSKALPALKLAEQNFMSIITYNLPFLPVRVIPLLRQPWHLAFLVRHLPLLELHDAPHHRRRPASQAQGADSCLLVILTSAQLVSYTWLNFTAFYENIHTEIWALVFLFISQWRS